MSVLREVASNHGFQFESCLLSVDILSLLQPGGKDSIYQQTILNFQVFEYFFNY